MSNQKGIPLVSSTDAKTEEVYSGDGVLITAHSSSNSRLKIGGAQPEPAAGTDDEAAALVRTESGISGVAEGGAAIVKIGQPIGDSYGGLAAMIFMLNMVFGTGPLTLPFAVDNGGIFLAAICLLACMFTAYLTTGYIVEALSLANALCLKKALSAASASDLPVVEGTEGAPRGSASHDTFGASIFKIRGRFEFGGIGDQLLSRPLAIFAYVILVTYTFGVLTVYCITPNVSIAEALGADPVTYKRSPDGFNIYNILTTAFACMVIPLCFANLQKTRVIQIVIMTARATALILMIGSTGYYLATGHKVPVEDVKTFEISEVSTLFGNIAFTFMVHHSLPGLVAPLADHKQAPKVIATAYCGSVFVYLILCTFAVFSFAGLTNMTCSDQPGEPCAIQKLYNLNFSSSNFQFIAVSIVWYPILMVSIFPIVAISVRNNLYGLAGQVLEADKPFGMKNLGFTFLTVLPPFVIAFVTQQVQELMAIVGSFAGLTLMILCPVMFLYFGRQKCRQVLGANLVDDPDRPMQAFGGNAVGFVWCLCVYAVGIVFACIRTPKLMETMVDRISS